jgi:holo-[acyl-carrier protein] synthase
MEIGLDCVDIRRFKKNIHSKKNILTRIFTKNEIQYCENKEDPVQHYAVRFAAKEAVIKALYAMDIELKYRKIEILNKKNGIPYVNILEKFNYKIKISLTHSKHVAIAFVIID